MMKKIRNNELNWLFSAGCTIARKLNDNIRISNDAKLSSDFNFVDIYSKYIDYDIPNFRVSTAHKNIQYIFNSLIENHYALDNSFDINFLYTPKNVCDTPPIHIAKENFTIILLSPEEVSDYFEGYSILNENKHLFYIFKFDNAIIGKFSALITDIIGIYDFEIFNAYRGNKLGAFFLENLLQKKFCGKFVYLQTWSQNTSAIKTYLSVGFRPYESLLRFSKIT